MITQEHAESVIGSVSKGEALDALDAVLSSADFASSPHLAAFLTYSVNETLEGRASELKAYTVATCVLGRSSSFDPQSDPIVRVEATRLRRAMERYYSGAGSSDPVQIMMPRGGYKINFSRCDNHPNQRKSGSPVADERAFVPSKSSPNKQILFGWDDFKQHPYWLATLFVSAIIAGWTWGIFPFYAKNADPAAKTPASLLALHVEGKTAAELGLATSPQNAKPSRSFRIGGVKIGTFAVEGNASMPWHVGAKISEEFTEALSRFDSLSVYDWRSAIQPDGSDVYELSGRAIVDGPQTNSISVRIVHIPSQRMVWSRDYSRTPESRPGSFWRQDVIRAVSTAIASNEGVILRDATATAAIDDPSVVAKFCILRAMESFRLPDPEQRTSARQCIDEALRIYPQSPNLLGISARLRLESPDAGPEDLKLSLDEAQRANVKAPQSALITNILADVNTRLGLTERASQLGKLALDLNPYDATILASQATRLASIGDKAGAADLLSQIEPEFKTPTRINTP